jgi:hypothetical protein
MIRIDKLCSVEMCTVYYKYVFCCDFFLFFIIIYRFYNIIQDQYDTCVYVPLLAPL